MKRTKTGFLALAALIAALYCVVTLIAAPISFGPIQLRISEVFTILPLFSAAAVPGLTVGCLLSNLLGFVLGLNPIGLIDSLFGTTATLLAALCTFWTGKTGKRFALLSFGPLFPVLFNGVVIGTELTLLSGSFSSSLFFPLAGSVALGEAAVCYLLGIPLILLLFRKAVNGTELYRQIFKY